MFNIQPDDKLYLLLWALGSRVFILFALIRFLIVNGLTVLEWVRPHMCVCARTRVNMCAHMWPGLQNPLLESLTHASFSLYLEVK